MDKKAAWLGETARKAVRSLARIYYPNIEFSGQGNIPSHGPTLFVANHANSLFDPVIIGIATRRSVYFMAKAPLFDLPLLGPIIKAVGMIPVYRGSDDRSQLKKNLESLDAAAELLAQGIPVGIFPEGKSHDLPRVEAVHSGAARMAMKAFKAGAATMKVSVLGINYQRKQEFRSSIRICAAEPIEIAALLETCGNDERKAARLLTAEIEAKLKQTVIHLEDAAWAPFLDALEILLPADGDSGKSKEFYEQRKLIADAINHFMAEEGPGRDKALEIAEDILGHKEHLLLAGLELSSPLIRLGGLRIFLSPLLLALKVVVGAVPAMAGTFFHLIPFAAVRGIAKLIPSPGQMTAALTRIMLGTPIYALWYAFTAWLAASYFAPLFVVLWFSIIPFAGFFALDYWRRLRDKGLLQLRQIRSLFHLSEIKTLRDERKNLEARLAEMTRLYETNKSQKIASEQTRKKGFKRKIFMAAAFMISALGLSFVAFFHFQQREIPELVAAGPNLKQANLESLEFLFDSDQKTLLAVFEGLKELEDRALTLKEEFSSDKRNFYSQADNDAVRRELLRYINHRTALLRIVWRWQNYRQITDEPARLRAMLLGLSAASSLYEASLRFVVHFGDSPEIIKKLNEEEPLWEVPQGFYSGLKRNLLESSHRNRFNDAMEEYRKAGFRFEALNLGANSNLKSFHSRINQAEAAMIRFFSMIEGDELTEAVKQAGELIADKSLYAQSVVSIWVGDTKIRTPRKGRALITPEQVEELRPRLRPGDIILERRNWYLSNAFLPGYWPHSALYVGTSEDLERLGLHYDPRVRPHLAKLTSTDRQGRRPVIIESVSEGVIFSSLEHSVGEADSVAVLRPAISGERIAESIARAFSHVGKPYDFDFDFFSTDKLVCTELVFRAYDGDVEFPLVDVLGRKTMPALEIARKFVIEKNLPEKQLKFVAFLDGDESQGKAEFKGPGELEETLERPALTWLQGF